MQFVRLSPAQGLRISARLSYRPFSQTSVPIASISELRKLTGASIQKCKQALEGSDCNMMRAIEVLRKRGECMNASHSVPIAGGFKVSASVSSDSRKAVISKTSSQTDFASDSELFVKFSETLNRNLLSNGDIPFRNMKLDRSFSSQIHSDRFDDVLSEMSGILCEPIRVAWVERLEGDLVSVYIHNKSQYSGRVGTAISAVSFMVDAMTAEQHSGLRKIGDRLARQIIASTPKYIDFNDVPQNFLQEARDSLNSRIKQTDKVEKAFKGYVDKFKSDNCLLDMEWIIPFENCVDADSFTVRQVLEKEAKQIGIQGLRVCKFTIIK